jgi:hypothetical protein
VKPYIKLLTAMAVVTALAGCGAFTARFDNQEYMTYVSMSDRAVKLNGACGDTNKERAEHEVMRQLSNTAVIYAGHRPDEVSKEFASTMAGLVLRFKVGGSVVYCKESAENMRTAASTILYALGARSHN